jgi:hypothetical protein
MPDPAGGRGQEDGEAEQGHPKGHWLEIEAGRDGPERPPAEERRHDVQEAGGVVDAGGPAQAFRPRL